MNIEFHYYITYLIALKAGFCAGKAYSIAYSSQFVDDNQQQIEVVDDDVHILYRSTPTQIAMLSTGKRRDEILQTHHFLPGDNEGSPLVSTPNCKVARVMLEEALASGNPYLIGIASHAYLDTWAHQGFAGCRAKVNGMPGWNSAIIPNIGHADALDDPDSVDAWWFDGRLPQKVMIKNSERFLDAAFHLYIHYHRSLYPGKTPDCGQLLSSLAGIFAAYRARYRLGRHYMMQRRKKQYNRLALAMSGLDIPQYRENLWRDCALKAVQGDGGLFDKYRWRRGINLAVDDWFQFQEAAKEFQQRMLPFIRERSGDGVLARSYEGL